MTTPTHIDTTDYTQHGAATCSCGWRSDRPWHAGASSDQLWLRHAVEAYQAAEAQLQSYAGVVAMLTAILDEHYPPDVFTGESSHLGARLVVKTRELLQRMETQR